MAGVTFGIGGERGCRRCTTLPPHDPRGGQRKHAYAQGGSAQDAHPRYGLSVHTRMAMRCRR